MLELRNSGMQQSGNTHIPKAFVLVVDSSIPRFLNFWIPGFVDSEFRDPRGPLARLLRQWVHTNPMASFVNPTTSPPPGSLSVARSSLYTYHQYHLIRLRISTYNVDIYLQYYFTRSRIQPCKVHKHCQCYLVRSNLPPYKVDTCHQYYAIKSSNHLVMVDKYHLYCLTKSRLPLIRFISASTMPL